MLPPAGLGPRPSLAAGAVFTLTTLKPMIYKHSFFTRVLIWVLALAILPIAIIIERRNR